jgi:hypothetical protein
VQPCICRVQRALSGEARKRSRARWPFMHRCQGPACMRAAGNVCNVHANSREASQVTTTRLVMSLQYVSGSGVKTREASARGIQSWEPSQRAKNKPQESRGGAKTDATSKHGAIKALETAKRNSTYHCCCCDSWHPRRRGPT